jgi:hypothetical protein
VQAAAKCGRRGILNRFASSRMRLHHAGKVLEHSSHFHHMGQRRNQFRYPGTNGLRPQHEMILRPRDNPDETAIVQLG